MKRITLCLMIAAASLIADAQVKVKSPDGDLVARVELNASGRLNYRITLDKTEVLPASPLGITVDGVDLGTGITLGKPKTRRFKESYSMVGNHDKAINHFREAVIPLLGTDGEERAFLEIRVFNDGVAYRYRVPGNGEQMITGEAGRWTLPAGSTLWYQDNLHSYEGIYNERNIESLKKGSKLGLPVTVRLADKSTYLMLSEANLINYSDMALQASGNNSLEMFFPADVKGWKNAGEIVSPWRVVLIAGSLDTLVDSDIIMNLCPPPSDEIAKADFYKPGRAVWHWWSIGGPPLAEQQWWFDRTRELGFEYYLIDGGWSKWKDGDKDAWACLRDVVAYGTSVGVKSVIWVHSKEVTTAEDRMAYMKRVKDCGITGIKIDFMPPANSWWVQWYEDTLRDAAKIGLFVDFHGAVKPSGRARTWPHELTREGVRGHEWHISRYKRVQLANYDTVVPFCRNLQGAADYTPTVFDPSELNGFTWARELAQAVLSHSPFLCYADNPKYYLANPALEVLRTIPATWNETRVLPGSEIGKLAAFARRDGKTWYVGIINADQPQEITVDCSFLGRGSWRMLSFGDQKDRDDGYETEDRAVTRKEKLNLKIRKNGGFVARFTSN